ncbi:hypothetical protein ES703_59863 [subsurface metagenome]
MHDEIDGAGLFVDVEDFLPCFSAVCGFVHTALFVMGPLMTGSRHIDDIRILRVNDDPGNRIRSCQAHVLPGLAGIRGLVHSASCHRAAEDIRLTRSDPHYIRIRGSNGHITDRCGGCLVEDGFPCGALIDGFPDSAGCCGHIDDVVFSLRSDHGDIGAPAAYVCGTDVLPLHVFMRGGLSHFHVLVVPFHSELWVCRMNSFRRFRFFGLQWKNEQDNCQQTKTHKHCPLPKKLTQENHTKPPILNWDYKKMMSEIG